MTDDAPKIHWPGRVYGVDTDAVGPGIRGLLEELRLLETKMDEDKKPKFWEGTPQSLQVLTAGATSITKLHTVLATAVGGGGAIVAGIRTLYDFGGSDADQAFQRAAFMMGAAVLGSAVVIAVAIMVRSDVGGRAQAQAATYAARAEVSAAALRTLGSAVPAAPQTTPYFVKSSNGWEPVTSFKWKGGRIVAKTAADEIRANEMTGLIQFGDLTPPSTP